MDQGRSAQDEQDVEQVGADDVAQRQLPFLLGGGRHAGGQFRPGSAAGFSMVGRNFRFDGSGTSCDSFCEKYA